MGATMIEWCDTPPPPPPGPVAMVNHSETATLIASLQSAGFQFRLEVMNHWPPRYELHVDPRGYHSARACVYWIVPWAVRIDVIPLEL